MGDRLPLLPLAHGVRSKRALHLHRFALPTNSPFWLLSDPQTITTQNNQARCRESI